MAAEALSVPVIVQAGSSAFAYARQYPFMTSTISAAQTATVSVGVHLDHSRDIEEIRRALDAGYSSIMVDGSHLQFDANVELTTAVVELAGLYGAWVEGELGVVTGDEDASTHAVAGFGTDPDAAARFVEATGVDALAVAVGNVHGFTAEPPQLDLRRLAAIHAACPVPLVLHGASGVEGSQMRTAVASGVAKVNFNTELRRAFLEGLDLEAGKSSGWAISAAFTPAKKAVQALVQGKLELLSTPNLEEVRHADRPVRHVSG